MIPVVMNQFGFTLQQAVDFVGFKCRMSIENFERDRNRLPSWGPKIDCMVEKYVDGLQNWIVGPYMFRAVIVLTRLDSIFLSAAYF
jgi:hypothetical protein